ncbi:MAG TPA: hypothetical protein DCW29_22170 [Janthinobacterium sp.]|nr:hypothetical protein [Janthinobacterium sp.]
MGWLKQNQSKSLLGQLLVQKKLISEEQLAKAMESQRATGQRLGDILAEWNLITQQHVQDALRKQRHLRMAAALATALLAPLESYAVEALPTIAISTPVLLGRNESGLQMLTEDELGGTSAQGLNDDLLHQLHQQGKGGGLEVVGDLAKLLNPVLGFLESDVSMKDVVYDPAKAAAAINKDGSLSLRLPSSIGEINFQNIRVQGTEGPSFGSISIKGIDLTGTTITLAFKH